MLFPKFVVVRSGQERRKTKLDQKTVTAIRHATLTDALLLAELGARTFRETFAADNTDEDMAQYLLASFNPEHQHAELAEPQTTFLIAEIDNVAAGYAMLRAGPPPNHADISKPMELVRLYVGKEWLGAGIGAALMEACLAETGRQGYLNLWLGVWERNPRALAFYRKWKFEEFGEHIFELGSDLQNDILLRRPVSDKL